MKTKMKNDKHVEKCKSCFDFFNEVFRNIEDYESMFSRSERMLLKASEAMKWNFNESDFPERPNTIFLEDNQIYLLVPYLSANDTKNGCQRSFDNFFMLLSPDSFAKNKRMGRQVVVSDIRNRANSPIDNYRPGLRWVKFGVYRQEDLDNNSDYMNLIKRKAGLEMLVFLYYYMDRFKYFTKYFGQFPIEGYHYYTSANKLTDYLAYVYKDDDSDKPAIEMMLSQEVHTNCLFLVDDLI